MGIKFGEIDASQILENEFRITAIEKVIDVLIAANPSVATTINIRQIREEVVRELQKKYPNSGVSLKEG